MAKNILVKLGGVDCTTYLRRARKTTTYGDAIATYDFEFTKNIEDLIPIDASLSVDVWLDTNTTPTTKVFSGFINNFSPEAGAIKITAKDKLAGLINKEITQVYDSSVISDPSYPDGKLSAIFNDIVTTYGLLSTNSGATVQDSGTDIVLSRFVCNHADPFERCRKLAESLNWVFYYRADTDYVYFEPKNYTTNSNTLQVGVNVLEVPTWDYDRSEMINDLRLEGAQQLVQSSMTFTGSGSSGQVLTLTYMPDSVAVYYSAAKNYATTAKLSSEVKIGNITNSLATHDYEVDVKAKTITLTGFTAAASTNNILVEYSYYVPIPIHMDSPESKATYDTYAKTITLTDVVNLEDAWKRAENILSKYSAPFKSAKLKTKWTSTLDVQVGQAIKVIDLINNPQINETMTIYKVVDYWPEAFTEIEVGDKQYTIQEYQANLIERIKRLEENASGTTDAVSEIVQNKILFGLVPESTQFDIELVNDSFILNHPINGILYDETETAILDDFESAASWTGVNCTLTDDSTAGHFQVGTQGVNASWTGAVTATLTKAISSTDISGSTGASSGTPITGTVGIWVYATSGSKVTSISLKLGSDSSNYALMTAQTFGQANGLTTSFSLQDGLNYLVFDLPTATLTGTPVWTATDYSVISVVTNATSNATFDYFTVSKNNDIGLNGLGSRSTTWSSTTVTW